MMLKINRNLFKECETGYEFHTPDLQGPEACQPLGIKLPVDGKTKANDASLCL